jgi:predicted nucleotidyltransferase
MNHGLSANTVERIVTALAHYPEIEKAVLYGSRAKGNYRTGSDIDLTLFGDRLNHTLLMRLENELDDLLLPYKFDLSLFADLTHAELIDHIRRVGVVFYEKKPMADGVKN